MGNVNSKCCGLLKIPRPDKGCIPQSCWSRQYQRFPELCKLKPLFLVAHQKWMINPFCWLENADSHAGTDLASSYLRLVFHSNGSHCTNCLGRKARGGIPKLWALHTLPTKYAHILCNNGMTDFWLDLSPARWKLLSITGSWSSGQCCGSHKHLGWTYGFCFAKRIYSWIVS